MVSHLLSEVSTVVTVERGQFGIADGDDLEDASWLSLRVKDHGFAVGSGGIKVASTIAMHDADIAMESWDGDPPPAPAGFASLGRQTFRSSAGFLVPWAFAHGPTDVELALPGPGRYAIEVFRHGGGADARAMQETSDPPVFEGLERYLVRLWPQDLGP
ncbi:hypothetical protein [Actinomadura rupiterrae]|uniref:hypothetical protein n=1 Tax=Actinomadura rupiterrae TaxID=559627 RepID=UPI0020A56546|nr:hypothetical protein [Actinomadura rupiterrae]MCP2337944.1 hypothetical protein [Actinomadura rupiterrae]